MEPHAEDAPGDSVEDDLLAVLVALHDQTADQQQSGEVRIELRRVAAQHGHMVTDRQQRRLGERTEADQTMAVQPLPRSQDAAGRFMDDRRMRRVPRHDNAGLGHVSPVC
ncbi:MULTISPECIES: hypothetical protein [Streptomyces]|uniref:Uncharacterized protein n=1 Tax=Streptomyces canarius TaxID=285453 RepID=A0ABQ3D5Z8_9ACTN|nr:hypothetical protein [Streptomyces canarius]GHA58655.1 hypothetical protein GCM10010345_73740 [Streptomyces canarius]